MRSRIVSVVNESGESTYISVHVSAGRERERVSALLSAKRANEIKFKVRASDASAVDVLL